MIRSPRLTRLASRAVAIPLLAALLTAAAPGGASAAASCTWKVVPSPNVGSSGNDNELDGVAMVSPADAWAVGSSGGNTGQTLAEHWNGSSWSIVSSPDPGGSAAYDSLNGVTAVSATDVWAVGTYYDGRADQTLVEHWDGTSWTVVPSPSPYGRSYDSQLFSVAAVSASDIWAVGVHAIPPEADGAPRTLIEHWNGTTWQIVGSPNPTHWTGLSGVAATSSSNAWAVGYDLTPGLHPHEYELIEHWDGTNWQIVPTPVRTHPGSSVAFLSGVAALSGRVAWTAGTSIRRWNGATWRRMPVALRTGDYFQSVAATSALNVWAVGSYGGRRNIIDHWNGTSWQMAASPQPGQADFLRGVAATSHDAWAVGGYRRSRTSTTARTLIMNCQ